MGQNKNHSRKKSIYHTFNWFLANILAAFLPLGLAMLFKAIVGYTPTFKDFAPDYLLTVSSVLFSIRWGISQNKKYTDEGRNLALTVYFLLSVASIGAYFALFGDFTIPTIFDSNKQGANMITIIASVVLIGVTGHGIRDEYAQYKSDSPDSSPENKEGNENEE